MLRGVAGVIGLHGVRTLHFELIPSSEPDGPGDRYHLRVNYEAWSGKSSDWTLNPTTRYGDDAAELPTSVAETISEIVKHDFDFWRPANA